MRLCWVPDFKNQLAKSNKSLVISWYFCRADRKMCRCWAVFHFQVYWKNQTIANSKNCLVKSSKLLANFWNKNYSLSILCRCQLDGHVVLLMFFLDEFYMNLWILCKYTVTVVSVNRYILLYLHYVQLLYFRVYNINYVYNTYTYYIFLSSA